MVEFSSRDVIDKSNIEAEEIDTIIYCAVCRMYAEPATAAVLQKRLGIQSAMSFDVSDACLSFLNGLILADSLIQTGRSQLVLVAGAEKAGSKVLINSLNSILHGNNGIECLASLTLGDGSVAALVGSSDYMETAKLKLKAFSRTTIAKYSEICTLVNDDSPMVANPKEIIDGCLRHLPQMIYDLLHDINWSLDDIAMVVPHQPSIRFIEKTMNKINFPMDKVALTLEKFGNMASVSMPFTLASVLRSNAIKSADKVLILGVGSGLSFSIMALEVL
jgi:3-oxoacyl-[acyl-carrier-protein] synthase-3